MQAPTWNSAPSSSRSGSASSQPASRRCRARKASPTPRASARSGARSASPRWRTRSATGSGRSTSARPRSTSGRPLSRPTSIFAPTRSRPARPPWPSSRLTSPRRKPSSPRTSARPRPSSSVAKPSGGTSSSARRSKTASRSTPPRPSPHQRYPRPVARREYALVGAVWAVWVLAILGVVIGGVASGEITDPLASWIHYGGRLWPLFIWDYGWYHGIAMTGYPPDLTGPQYAFFPLWPAVLRASGSIPDWVAAFGVATISSGLAFLGVAAASPSRRRLQAALALACWPGSFLLLLGYPDVIALAAGAWAAALALRGRPWAAGVLGGLAAVARPTGFLIAIPLLFVTRGSIPGRVFAVVAPLAGAVAVNAYFWARSGDDLAFVHAQSLPIWARNGPGRLTKWPGHIVDAFAAHWLLVLVAVVLGTAVVAVVTRRFGLLPAVVLAYLGVSALLLLGAQTPQTRIESAILAVAMLMLVVLVRLGPLYWPWTAFVTAILAISVFSGSVTSFGRQALFAFPLYWAAADGPRPFRHPLVAVAAVAANVAFALTLAKYAP